MPQNNNEIFTLILEPYGGCNIRCRHCYADTSNESVMSIEDFTLIIEKVVPFVEKKGFDEIHLIWHGGEPLLAGIDFFRQAMEILNGKISRLRQRHFIQTNGLLLDDEFCCFLRDNKIEVGLSLDGPPDLHDQLRVDLGGRGTHASVLEKIHQLEKNRVPVGFNAVISRATIGQEKRLYRFFQEMGYGFRINPIIPGRDPNNTKDYLLQKGEYGEFLGRLFDVWTQTETRRIDVSPLDAHLYSVLSGANTECQHQYLCVDDHIGVKPSGEAVLCNRFQGHGFGNILKDSMSDILASFSRRKILKRADDLMACQSCQNAQICHGGCPCNSVAFGGDFMAKDPFCEDYKMIFAHIRRVLKDHYHQDFYP